MAVPAAIPFIIAFAGQLAAPRMASGKESATVASRVMTATVLGESEAPNNPEELLSKGSKSEIGKQIEEGLAEVLEFCQECGEEVLTGEVVSGGLGLVDKGIEKSSGQQIDLAKLFEA
jgi:hypothetical protein